MDISQLIQNISIYAIPVLLSITLHEAAHGYVARHFGDNTAWSLGRVTLNPFKHIDPVGTILIPIALLFMTGGKFLFGYAKPVPVRMDRLRNPRRDMLWVALAGPGSNFIQAIFWASLYYLLQLGGIREEFFLKMCTGGVLVNVVMFVFNLFPLLPLDGGRILASLLPPRRARQFARVEPCGFYIVLLLVVTGVAGAIWMMPLMHATYGVIETLMAPLRALLQ